MATCYDSLAYDGYDPSWIIGTHIDSVQPWTYRRSRSLSAVNCYYPHREAATTSWYRRYMPCEGSPTISMFVPKPVATLYAQGHCHSQGCKNIVVLRVPFCCEGCEDRWKDNLTDLPGFRGVDVDRRHHGRLKATVFGNVETYSVLEAVQKVQPRAELWG